MSAGDEVRITSAEAIPLAYALTARVAADHGIDLMAIKGMVLAHHELRAPRVSADVDVLVAPHDGERFADAMQALGWRRPPDAEAPRLRRQHAINLVNDHWPIGIDVHVYFPGFLAPDSEVFGVLWDERVTLELAEQPVLATGALGSAAIAALHHLREEAKPDNRQAFGLLLEKSQARFSPAERAQLGDLATRTGSRRSLRPLLEALEVPDGPEHPAEESGWETWHTASHAEFDDVWWTVLRRTPWRERPAFLRRALMPDEARLRELYLHDVSSPLRELRLRRLKHVLKRLPDVLRARHR